MSRLRQFFRIEAASGFILLGTAFVALLWANAWHASYAQVHAALHFFVNDVLMGVFFFVVGMEIRRELQVGELSTWKKASLPLFAAFGGMVVPALIYLALAPAGVRHGWGVPTATDIAFALGVLSLLGSRVPSSLRVLLLALAVIDDVGGIIVIALFYAGGVHPAIVGVVLGLLVPVRFLWVERLHPLVAYGIMPLFALVNAGVVLGGGGDVSWATTAALFVGKPLGVCAACALAINGRVSVLPKGLSARHVVLLGVAAGVGFTMSLFIAQLAFSTEALDASKRGVLLASGLAAVTTYVLGRSHERRT